MAPLGALDCSAFAPARDSPCLRRHPLPLPCSDTCLTCTAGREAGADHTSCDAWCAQGTRRRCWAYRGGGSTAAAAGQAYQQGRSC